MSYGREVVAALLKAGRRDLPARPVRRACPGSWNTPDGGDVSPSLGLATMHFTQGKEMLLFTPKGERFAKKHGGARR